jgi:alcohol dehydrogenase class IV
MLFNLDECPKQYAQVAGAMGLDTGGLSDLEAGEAAANAIWDLTRKMGVPQRLRDAGVPEDGLAEAANLSMSDGTIVFNPKMIMEAEEVLEVYRKAW